MNNEKLSDVDKIAVEVYTLLKQHKVKQFEVDVIFRQVEKLINRYSNI